jgi:hypothetical protein
MTDKTNQHKTAARRQKASKMLITVGKKVLTVRDGDTGDVLLRRRMRDSDTTLLELWAILEEDGRES